MSTARFADYRLLHSEVERIVQAATADELDQRCRACPDWTIRQVVGHMVHTLASGDDDPLPNQAIRDAVIGDDKASRAAGRKARDEWTNAGAVRFDHHSIDGLLEAWRHVIANEPEVGLLLIPDVAVHLHDIAESLSVEAGGRPHVLLGLSRYSNAHAAALAARGLPAVQLYCSDGGERFGDVGSELVVSGPAYDLCRILMGRRTPAEADAVLDWGSAPEELRTSFPLYGLHEWQQRLVDP